MRFIWKAPRPPTVELGAMRRLPKNLVNVRRIREDLTVQHQTFWLTKNAGISPSANGIEPTLILYREDETTISVPRHYEVPYTTRPRVVDKRWTSCGEPWYVAGNIELRDDVQSEASTALSESVQDKIISLACGKGKTVVSLHAAIAGGRFPALVVVHTNALLDQWRERIHQFYDLKPSKVGHIQGSVFQWKDCPIAIAMLHSLVLKKYPEEFYNHWRLLIFDEVHKLGAQTFLKAASMFPGERWGLSATVEREDKMDQVFQMHLGQVAYKFLEQPLKPRVYFVDTKCSMDISHMVLWGGRINMGRLHTNLSEDDNRNALILEWLHAAYKRGRTILVLGERVAQLHMMFDKLRDQGLDAALHVGAMGKEERAEALTHRVVLATQHIAKEGLDRPAFDTLFVLTTHGGQGRVQQEIGRILRLDDNKKPPRVFVFEDRISIMRAMGNKMRKIVYSMDFEVRTIDGVKDVDNTFSP